MATPVVPSPIAFHAWLPNMTGKPGAARITTHMLGEALPLYFTFRSASPIGFDEPVIDVMVFGVRDAEMTTEGMFSRRTCPSTTERSAPLSAWQAKMRARFVCTHAFFPV